MKRVDGRLTYAVDEAVGVADAFRHPDDQHGLAPEPAEVHVLVGGDDHTVSGVDIVVGQDVLGPDGALRLHLHGDTTGLGSLGQFFRSHVRMSDTGGARRHGEQFQPRTGGGSRSVSGVGRTGHVETPSSASG